MDLETIAMTLVGNAGEGRSLAFEALNEAKKVTLKKLNNFLKNLKKEL